MSEEGRKRPLAAPELDHRRVGAAVNGTDSEVAIGLPPRSRALDHDAARHPRPDRPASGRPRGGQARPGRGRGGVMKQITVISEDRPGVAADITSALAAADVNIDTFN